MSTPDMRCTSCRAEFVHAEVPEHQDRCPNCGTTSLPTWLKDEQDWTLPAVEWAILGGYAKHWARSLDSDCQATLDTILDQVPVGGLPDTPCTARFTPHELRIITIWASNAFHDDSPGATPQNDQAFTACLEALRQQAKSPICLTMEDEFQSLRDAGYDIQVRYGGEAS